MQQNPMLVSGVPINQSQAYYYDPSAYYRTLLQPQPPPPPPEVPHSNPYPSSRTPPQVVPSNYPHASNQTPPKARPSVTYPQTQINDSRIPQHYYIDNAPQNDFPPNNPNYTAPYDANSNVADPYLQPVPVSSDPYTTAPYYSYVSPTTVNNPSFNPIQPVYEQPASSVIGVPYSTAYVQPAVTSLPPLQRVQVVPTQPFTNVTTVPYARAYTIPPVDHNPTIPDQSLPGVVNSQRKDTNLSRLEVYHFTQKKKTPVPAAGVYATQPPVQYYAYPYTVPTTAPIAVPTAAPMTVPTAGFAPDNSWYDYQPNTYSSYNYPQYDYSSYAYPQYDYSSYAYPSYYPNYNYPQQNYPQYNYPYPSETVRLPPIAKKASGSQTEKVPTTTRALSPMHSHSTPLDKNNYSSIHQRILLEERLPEGSRPPHHQHNRSDAHYLRGVYSTPLPDCRCIHCQRERNKVLNYYPD
ncbi:hypothetical protein I4U23_000549 [Adineta vaga]|nr:hypothetical protein I4U23_000549 [Adineta vaga]